MGRKLCYDVTLWDQWSFDKILADRRQMESDILRISERVTGFDLFAPEVFHRLFNTPAPIDPASIRAEHQWAVKAHAKLSENPDFQALEGKCYGDRYLAGLGSTKFLEELIAKFPRQNGGAETENAIQDPQALRDQCKQAIEEKQFLKQQLEELKSEDAEDELSDRTAEREEIESKIEALSETIAELKRQKLRRRKQ
jgi:hypothetical protein